MKTLFFHPMRFNPTRLLYLLLCIGVACTSSRQQAAEKPVYNPQSGEVINDGVAVEYTTCGEADTTLLFVHGWSIDQSYWEPQVEAFCQQYRVITVNLPGFHENQPPRSDWSVEAFAKDVQTVIDALQLNNVVLIGHSMGGDIILETALNRPDQTIGFVGVDNFKDAGIAVDPQTEAAIQEFFTYLKSDFPATVGGYANDYLLHSSTDTLIRKRIIGDMTAVNQEVATQSLKKLFEYGPKEIVQLSKLPHKVYLINSDVTPTDLTHLHANDIEVEVLNAGTTGHYPMLEKPERFNALLKEVVSSIKK